MLHLIVLSVASLGLPSEKVISASARIHAASLEPSKEYEIRVDVSFQEGVSASAAGIPAPILQVEVPPCAELLGKVLTTREELGKNEYLQAPYERLVKDLPASLGFKLLKPPAADDAFAINVLVYASPGGDEAFFVRRRLVLPVSPMADAKPVEPTTSAWSGTNTLQIGDRAAKFSLPKADGTKVSLDQYLGKKNVIVTTYRAHW